MERCRSTKKREREGVWLEEGVGLEEVRWSGVSMDEVRKHVLGAKVQEGKTTIESKKGLSIMIHFDEDRLPMKLYARYMQGVMLQQYAGTSKDVARL